MGDFSVVGVVPDFLTTGSNLLESGAACLSANCTQGEGMRFFFQTAAPVLLAAFGTVLVFVLWDGGHTGQIVIPAVYFAVIGLFLIAGHRMRAAGAWPAGRRAALALGMWWCVCAGSFPVTGFLAVKAARNMAFAYPETVRAKLEAYKTASGHYPVTLREVVPLDVRRFLVQYRSDGRLFEFTIRSKGAVPRLWVYDGESRAWSRESD